MKQPDFRKIIREAMTAQGVESIAECARLCQVHRPNLNDYLNGKADLYGETLERIFGVLKIEVKNGK